ncbi:copper resistance protein CopD [Campylobacter sp. Cr9]|uniref:copper resistance protein CopD n=1 Tax=unclassified Campylobacter TaxID=2593542 RepID=UPI001EFC2A7F|nr:copper resistance protein CopD [Campylobacter sp. RM5004]MBZ7985043.1 copper resistance protein CopD [Campylobacter sp. Cr9]ULO01638.1 putative membrane protein [Campylobacter sp. RM5004]
MESLYPFALIIHVFCAIIFVGYLFFDVVIFSKAKKNLKQELRTEVQEVITKKAIKIMPICVLLLLLTGGMMMSKWVGSQIGYFDTTFQQIFMLKVFFACLIFIMVALSLSYKFILKKPNPLNKIIHPLALTLAILIVLCAKLMFYV